MRVQWTHMVFENHNIKTKNSLTKVLRYFLIPSNKTKLCYLVSSNPYFFNFHLPHFKILFWLAGIIEPFGRRLQSRLNTVIDHLRENLKINIVKRNTKWCIVIKDLKQTPMNCRKFNIIECLRKQKNSAVKQASNSIFWYLFDKNCACMQRQTI